jgi:hypothetical protein
MQRFWVNFICSINITFVVYAFILKTMEDTNKPNQVNINIELPEEVAEGIYSNLAVITHSNSEFIIDFIRIMPGIPKAKVKSRILLTPQHAKRLMKALKDNLAKFESVHGTVEDTEVNAIPMNFGGPTAQA